MSVWHEVEEEDIELDEGRGEVDILVTDDRHGNIYLTLTFEQINEIHRKINPN